MAEQKRPIIPVKPSGLEVIYLYPCPFCGRQVPLVAPVKPTVAECDACRQRFPVVPADEKTVRFVKLMTANGNAGIDPDYV